MLGCYPHSQTPPEHLPNYYPLLPLRAGLLFKIDFKSSEHIHWDCGGNRTQMINCLTCWCSSTIYPWVRTEVPVYCLCHNPARLMSPPSLLDFLPSHFSFCCQFLRMFWWPYISLLIVNMNTWSQFPYNILGSLLFPKSLATNVCQTNYSSSEAVAACPLGHI